MAENPYGNPQLRVEILTRQLEVNAASRAANAAWGTPAYQEKYQIYREKNRALQDYIRSLSR